MAHLSKRELWAKKTGKPKEEYRESPEGRAVTDIEEYYEEQAEFREERADMDIDRLKEDFERVLRMAGIQKTRAEEDYKRNLGNIVQKKKADKDDLNYYIETQETRTQEDLDSALAREAFRYEMEQERLNRSLATKNLVFGGLGKGGVAGSMKGQLEQEHEFQEEEFETEAERSFQDLKREEYVKNRNIEMQFEQQKGELGVKKKRAIEDAEFRVEGARTEKERGIEDIKFGEDREEWRTERLEDTDIADIQRQFAGFRQSKRHSQEKQAASRNGSSSVRIGSGTSTSSSSIGGGGGTW